MMFGWATPGEIPILATIPSKFLMHFHELKSLVLGNHAAMIWQVISCTRQCICAHQKQNKYNGFQPAIKARSKTKLGHRKNQGRGLICARASRAYINLFVNSERSEHLKWFCKCWAKQNMQNWPLKVTSFAKWAKRIACKKFCKMSGANFLQNILQLSEAKYAG